MSNLFRFVVVLFFTTAASVYASQGRAVFSSYVSQQKAELEADAVAKRMGIGTEVVSAVVNGGNYYRVVSETMPVQTARNVISEAKSKGFPSAWFVVSKTTETTETTKTKVSSPSEPQEVTLDRRSNIAALRRQNRSQTAVVITDARQPETPGKRTIRLSKDIVSIPRMEGASINLDGRVDESVWTSVPAFTDLKVVDPDTLADPEYPTAAHIFYTDKGIYVGAVLEQPVDTLVERLSTRDKRLSRDDFSMSLDTSGDGSYGYFFQISLGGTKGDGKILPERNISRQWDGAWEGKTAVTDSGWSAEMFIPWSILSMPDAKDRRSLPFTVSRYVAHKSERWMRPPLPRTSSTFISGFQPMELTGVNPKQHWEVFPYVSATEDRKAGEAEPRVGADFNWRPSSNMQLTATLNPDFGAVETDDVVVNLTAYETFFPEKRLFFLEGNEVFVTSPRGNVMMSSMGGGSSAGARRPTAPWTMEPTTMLNTRRIGGAAKNVEVPDSLSISGTELSSPTDLLGAAKFVGQAGGLRYGVLTAFEGEVDLRAEDDDGYEVDFTMDGRDFHVARVSYEAGGRGRKAIGYMGTMMAGPSYDAIVHGMDGHFRSANGKWMVDTQVLASDKDDADGYGMYTDIGWFPKQGHMHKLEIDYLDEGLDISDMGFIRRNDQRGMKYRHFRSKSRGLPDWLLNRRVGVTASYQENNEGLMIPRGNYAGTFLMLQLKNRSELSLMTTYRIGGWDDRESRGNGAYRTKGATMLMLTYGSDSSKKLSYSVQVGTQPEDMGYQSYMADFGVTYRPIDRFGLEFDYRYFDRSNWLVYRGDQDFTAYNAVQLAPTLSMDYFLTANQQFRLSMQWIGVDADENHFLQLPPSGGTLTPREKSADSESENFTLSRLTWQFRYRWEIAPMSDLFVVYTRGSNLPNQINENFEDLLLNAFTDTVVDTAIVKLRYRFGS